MLAASLTWSAVGCNEQADVDPESRPRRASCLVAKKLHRRFLPAHPQTSTAQPSSRQIQLVGVSHGWYRLDERDRMVDLAKKLRVCGKVVTSRHRWSS